MPTYIILVVTYNKAYEYIFDVNKNHYINISI